MARGLRILDRVGNVEGGDHAAVVAPERNSERTVAQLQFLLGSAVPQLTGGAEPYQLSLERPIAIETAAMVVAAELLVEQAGFPARPADIERLVGAMTFGLAKQAAVLTKERAAGKGVSS